jgi:hypothetical protein
VTEKRWLGLKPGDQVCSANDLFTVVVVEQRLGKPARVCLKNKKGVEFWTGAPDQYEFVSHAPQRKSGLRRAWADAQVAFAKAARWGR